MGPLDEILKMIPGANKIKGLRKCKIDEKQMGRVEAIIYSMTTARKNNILKLLMQAEKNELLKDLEHQFKK